MSALSIRRTRPPIVATSLAVAYGVLGVLTALLASSRCAGDGSFSLQDTGAHPSAYCKLTQFPGLPASIKSAIVVAVVHFGPLMAIMLGSFLASRRGSRRPLATAVAVASGWTLTALVLAASAHVTFVGF